MVFVTELTEAPRSTKSFTICVWPAAAAHHNGGAPSIVSPSNVTDPVKKKKIQKSIKRKNLYNMRILYALFGH